MRTAESPSIYDFLRLLEFLTGKVDQSEEINKQSVEYEAESDIFPVDKNPVSLKLVLKRKEIPADKQ